MKKFHKILALVLCLTMLCTTLVACGSKDDDKAGNKNNSGEIVLAEEQVLNLKYTDLSLIDVNDARNANEFQVLTQVHEGLFRTFTDENGQDVVEYAGCTSYDISEDGLTYTFHLREDAKWSDGVAITSQHYIDSWLRLINADNAFPYAELALGIAGAEAYYYGEGSIEDVAIEYIDDYTFSCTLAAPDSSFIKKVNMAVFYPIRLDLIEAAEAAGGDWTNDYTLHVFSGPFVISDRVLENSMTLTKNEYYWDAENVILEQVNLQVVAEDSTMAQLMESQQMDVWTPTDMEYVTLWENKVDNGDLNLSVSANPSVTYISVDMHKAGNGGPSGLMSNPKVRLAISLAFDREEYNELFCQGLATPAYGLVPNGISVGNTEFRGYTEGALEQYKDKTNDTEYLQGLLQEGLDELGYTGEISDIVLTTIIYAPTTQQTNVNEWYKQQLESKLGVQVNITVHPDVSTWKTARDSYEYDWYTMGWYGDYSDPVNFLDLFRTDNGYAKFMGGYSNPEYDALIEQAKVSTDDAERLELYAQAEKMLLEDGGVIPLFYEASYVYSQPYVGGLSLPMFGAEYEFTRAYIIEH